MIIGVDFDNTIVCYDELFYRAARDRQLVPAEIPPHKQQVRDYLRRAGQEDRWTELQGLVYGRYIEQAPTFPGVPEFLARCAREGVAVLIISHKTRWSLAGQKIDLHAAARAWLEAHEFFAQGSSTAPRQVFFEETKEQKLARIAAAGCHLYVDDLPEFLSEPGFPAGVEKILFDPHGRHQPPPPPLQRVASWQELIDTVFGELSS